MSTQATLPPRLDRVRLDRAVLRARGVPLREAIELDMPVGDGMKTGISRGAVPPEWMDTASAKADLTGCAAATVPVPAPSPVGEVAQSLLVISGEARNPWGPAVPCNSPSSTAPPR